MAVQILPPGESSGQHVATGLSGGLSNLLQGLAAGKVQNMQNKYQQQQGMQALQQMGMNPEQAQGLSQLATVNPQLALQYLKGHQKEALQDQAMQQKQQQMMQQAARIGERIQSLNEMNQQGMSSFFGGGVDADTYDAYAEELERDIRKIYPDAVVPRSKDSAASRKEIGQRIAARWEKDFGQQQEQPMLGDQQQGMPQQQNQSLSIPGQESLQAQQQIAQSEQDQGESRVAQVLRNLVGAGVQSAGPIASLLSPGAGQAILGSDIIRAGEHALTPDMPEISEEQLSQMAPDQREYVEEILKTKDKKLTDYLPTTTENIKNMVGKILPDEYLEPKSRGEAEVQNGISKAMGLWRYGGMSPLMATVSTGTGFGGKSLARKMGYGPLAQDVADFIFTTAPSLISNNARSALRGVAEKKYNAMPESAKSVELTMPITKEKARALRDSAAEYRSITSNKKVTDFMEDFMEQTNYDRMSFGDAVKGKRSIDRFLAQGGLDRIARSEVEQFRANLSKEL